MFLALWDIRLLNQVVKGSYNPQPQKLPELLLNISRGLSNHRSGLGAMPSESASTTASLLTH